MQIRTSIIGATGYTGIELVRLLQQHPKNQFMHLVSPSYHGQNIADVYPHLKNIVSETLCELHLNKIAEDSDIVFLALPHGESAKLIPTLLNAHCKIIDLSADLRLNNPKTYETWYNTEAAAQNILDSAVYGLPEIYPSQKIIEADVIANPGCYPTATILALAPLLKQNLIDLRHTPLIIDAKSGVSGAGRSANTLTHFCEVSNNFSAYQVGGVHRHTPEIEQELNKLASQDIMVQFTPHLIPTPRGMMVNTYVKLNNNYSIQDLEKIYLDFYEKKNFIRIFANNARANIKNVIGTNYCDIYLYLDLRTNIVTIISCIDNLIKGASGQAIQNMNIMSGLYEYTGLQHISLYP